MKIHCPTTLLEFQRMFSDEGACAAYLEKIRWPDGFSCQACGVHDDAQRMMTRPRVLRCRHCRNEVSLTAGTIMHATRMPLQVWFWGAYLVTTQTPGMSALQFQRQLGIRRYETAFQLLHKLRAGMVRPDQDRIGGDWPVEVDETLVGGKTRGEGRGVHHKIDVVGAVETREKLDKRGRKSMYAGRLRLLSMIHLVFSNLKAWLLGTHHGVSQQHLPAYLNEFVFRFNRRFYPMTTFATVLGIGMNVAGPTYRGLYDSQWDYNVRSSIADLQ